MHRWISIKDKQPEYGQTIVALLSWGEKGAVFETNICIWEYIPGQLKTMTHWMVLRPPLNCCIEEL